MIWTHINNKSVSLNHRVENCPACKTGNNNMDHFYTFQNISTKQLWKTSHNNLENI